jgi:hypothetical protein
MKELIKSNPLLRAIVFPVYRLRTLSGYLSPSLKQGLSWLLHSRETTNFTYELSEKNKNYLVSALSIVTGKPFDELLSYVREIENDASLKEHVAAATAKSDLASKADREARFHKRIGWYAITRAMKPKVVVETGVDKGLGSVVLCAALLRNRNDGEPGRYYGTDLNPVAGYLLSGKYAEVGEILYGDSIESLRAWADPIDIFINDSDHSAEYEAAEYETIKDKMSPTAVILGDNSHVTDKLFLFSRRNDRQFIFWEEEPVNHWYPGGGIGFSFNR